MGLCWGPRRWFPGPWEARGVWGLAQQGWDSATSTSSSDLAPSTPGCVPAKGCSWSERHSMVLWQAWYLHLNSRAAAAWKRQLCVLSQATVHRLCAHGRGHAHSCSRFIKANSLTSANRHGQQEAKTSADSGTGSQPLMIMVDKWCLRAPAHAHCGGNCTLCVQIMHHEWACREINTPDCHWPAIWQRSGLPWAVAWWGLPCPWELSLVQARC